ncbi:hypothetical protein ACLB2K_077600 [Fragaria x ananassa]
MHMELSRAPSHRESTPCSLVLLLMTSSGALTWNLYQQIRSEDYPFANNSLILWDAITKWVSDYVNHYYPDSELVGFDQELQAWWYEVRNKGHKDKKDEPWWPNLKTQEDVIHVLITIIWVTSGHHAAVN